jgi:hypothetical protein
VLSFTSPVPKAKPSAKPDNEVQTISLFDITQDFLKQRSFIHNGRKAAYFNYINYKRRTITVFDSA